MEIICTTDCYFAEALMLFNAGNKYQVSEENVKKMLDAGMGAYFTDMKDKPLKVPTEAPKAKEAAKEK